MAYLWDEQKRELNIQKHGLDFVDVHQIFAGVIFTIEDDRFQYPEPRYVTIGQLNNIVVVLVHADQGNDTRIISMRKATKHERRLYQQQF